jgi:ABC-type nitrate/sulfonate/bicarbonate transport system substrate-binding protein
MMRAWNWYAAPLIVAAITVLAAGCASGSGSAALTSLSRPEEQDVVVAALPAADLAGLYIAQDDGFSPSRDCT